jgi:uncharacterized membrane protein
VAHGHGHAGDLPASAATRRLLTLVVAPFALLTVVGLIVLWPTGERPSLGGSDIQQFKATATEVDTRDCGEDVPADFVCASVTVVIESGPDAGQEVSFDTAEATGTRKLRTGDKILVTRGPGAEGEGGYFFSDYQRSVPLIWLGLMFAVLVVVLSRWRGFAALIGLAFSLILLVKFILPGILQGQSPVLVSIVGSAAIMFITLYLAHGWNVRTTSAVIGTLISLSLTGLLAALFVAASSFTGLGSEEATFLQISAQQVNLEGLILGGIIIGSLGVLDDVTVTQASAVWELHRANPSYGARALYASALQIGRDHIASTVNTLVLAYAGASLPLLILFALSSRPLGQLLATEIVAEEIVRTLVGSIGLVASVPITTFLTSVVVSRDVPRRQIRADRARGRPVTDDFTSPKKETEWRI